MEFRELKQYLSHLPIVSSLVVDEVLFAYIAVALYAISLVLIQWTVEYNDHSIM